jgi:hypothetical protein
MDAVAEKTRAFDDAGLELLFCHRNRLVLARCFAISDNALSRFPAFPFSLFSLFSLSRSRRFSLSTWFLPCSCSLSGLGNPTAAPVNGLRVISSCRVYGLSCCLAR